MKENAYYLKPFFRLMSIAFVVFLFIFSNQKSSITLQSAMAADLHIVGLKFNGMVAAVGHSWQGQLTVESWTEGSSWALRARRLIQSSPRQPASWPGRS